ncbi:hypothetical protein LX32DRAFT_642478 [Colletotrichum zoysiae]|uniref:Uncharacterized protein n=1 Tax=Colletotrichum zoysiae TaxID=1216348 RepID=A0AAD9HB33_9PEZI|nr:hypothetical protein LX32DRAFT_642478 [Colletotrichum zoysiae]
MTLCFSVVVPREQHVFKGQPPPRERNKDKSFLTGLFALPTRDTPAGPVTALAEQRHTDAGWKGTLRRCRLPERATEPVKRTPPGPAGL